MFQDDYGRFKTILIVSLILVLTGVVLLFAISRIVIFQDLSDEIGSIGLSLITAGVLALTLDLVSVSAMSSRLNEIISNGLQELKMRDRGLADVTDSTPYEDMRQAIRKSKSFDLVQTFSPDMDNILDACRVMIRNGGSARIYLLDPECMPAKQRGADLGKSDDYASQKIYSNIEEVKSFAMSLEQIDSLNKDQIRKRIKLFTYSSLPTCAIYKSDMKIWVAFYWLRAWSDARMNLVVDPCAENLALAHIQEQIENVERISEEIDLFAIEPLEAQHALGHVDELTHVTD